MRRALLPLVGVTVFAIAAFGIWVLFQGFGQEREDEAPAPLPEPISYATRPAVGYLAPNVVLQTFDGKDVRLGDQLGKVVIVNFWASWCPICRSQMSTLARLATLAPRDVVVLAVNRAELRESATSMTSSLALPSNVLVLSDPTDEFYALYQGQNMPLTVFIDRDGVIRTVADQELSLPELNDIVLPLRKAPPACWQEGKGRTC